MVRRLSSLLLCLFVLAACGGAPPTPAAAAFPVTITHKHGSTEVLKQPEHIVTV